MAEVTKVEATISTTEKVMSFEAGRMANLANGSVIATLGDTKILVTTTAANRVREGIDFFPLTVDIEERSYAAGKIPGSFFRREGRSSEHAILTCRLIDRPLRPSFPKGFRNEVHVVGTVLGADQENPYDVVTLNAASAALCISGIPFEGPIGAVRIAYAQDGTWIPFPTYQEGDESTFEMVVAGRELDNGDVAVMMVEAGGTAGAVDYYENGAPKVDEAVLADGLEACKVWIKEAIALQRKLIATAGVKPALDFQAQVDYSDDILAAVAEVGSESLAASQKIADKADRGAAEKAATTEILAALDGRFDDVDGAEKQIKNAVRATTKAIVRKRVVDEGIRIDGRTASDVRPLASEVALIPTAHGSGLFQRGETQVLNITTLGTGRMDQMIDGIDPLTRKRYMHHYNFAPFCTGETGFMRGPKRREIGHGALAERALVPVIPKMEDFPYTLRLVSEVMASNGSSSMASVCSSSLSLMDAGVPIHAPVAGIAMGLIHEGDKYITITDILGAEDAMGDMDFKVAGTADFITALQLDTKIDGIPADVLIAALAQARDARMEILGVMADSISGPRDDVGPTAPKIVSFEIPIDKIGEVIGPKGKVINAIQADTGAEVSVDDDGVVGTVSVASPDRTKVEEAERQIRLILDPPTAEVGATYMGKVVNITNFGAFVNILPGRDGLLHISKIGGKRRIDKVEDELELGQDIEVIVEDIDPNGKVSLKEANSSEGDSSSKSSSDSKPARSEKPAKSDDSSSDDADFDDDSSSDDADSDDNNSDDNSSDESAEATETVSFDDEFDAQMSSEHGDLGPKSKRTDRGDRGRGRGGRRGGRR
jgi:polyribonucleotide nucleotidyltransferase